MNLTVLKSLGFIMSLITTIAGLLTSQGVILSGSTADHVVGWIVAIIGAVVGHQVTHSSATAAALTSAGVPPKS